MKLPEIKTPTYTIFLPGINKEIIYRPFLVKDQKVLLMSTNDKKDVKTLYRLVAELIRECTFKKNNPYKMPFFDVEYLFIKLKAKSGGDILSLNYKYTEKDKKGNIKVTPIKVEIDLEEVKIKFPENIENIIKIDNVTIELSYPTIQTMIDGSDNNIKLLAGCIEKLYTDEGDIYEKEDIDSDELEQWMEMLPSTSLSGIKDFFNHMPTIYLKKIIDLPNGEKKEIELKGLSDFFG